MGKSQKPKSKASKVRKNSSFQGNLLSEDKGESVDVMEPMRIGENSRRRGELSELAIDLTYKAAEFKASLPKGIRSALCDLVRNMNCYYSNLIEGHHTHPIAIEKALNEIYDADPEKRNLQFEAKAHIAVQRWIDEGGLPSESTSEASIREIHKRFVECLPEDLRWVVFPNTGEKLPVIPGRICVGLYSQILERNCL